MQKPLNLGIIHLDTMLKIDVFVAPDTSFVKETFNRRRKDILDKEQKQSEFYLASPEDIILNKLIWYLKSDGAFERQISDVIGILKVQESIDKKYLKRWAKEMGLEELLEKVFQNAGINF